MAEIVQQTLTLLSNKDHLTLITKLKVSPACLTNGPLITVGNLDTLDILQPCNHVAMTTMVNIHSPNTNDAGCTQKGVL